MDELLHIHNRLQNDLEFFAANNLQITTKDGPRVPFNFNKAQRYIHIKLEDQLKAMGMVRALLLKGRQQGSSTYVGGRYFQKSVTRNNINTFILSHDSQTTEKLFKMVDRYYKYLPEAIKPICSTKNQRKLEFEGLESTYSVGTAGNADVGRGGTLQLFHGSEVAFWQNTDNIDTGILQSVADLPGTEIILETTANGASGYYYEKCMMALEGKGDYQLIFVPWYWSPEYSRPVDPEFKLTEEELELKKLYKITDGQICWRRKKIVDFRGKIWKFKQEYPFNALEAFQSSGSTFFPGDAVVRAMRNPRPDERNAPTVVGVDPSGGGKDSVSISWRKSRDLYKREEIPGDVQDPQFQMYIVGRLVNILNNDEVDMMFIDRGYGNGIIARLYELGYGSRVMGFYFSDGAMNPDLYANKRAEMHDLYREWLKQPDVSIPNDMKAQKQIMAVPGEKTTSAGKMLIPSKDEVKKNNQGESPNLLDSDILTFAYPVRAKGAQKIVVNKANTSGPLQNASKSPLLTIRRNSGNNDNSKPFIITNLLGG